MTGFTNAFRLALDLLVLSVILFQCWIYPYNELCAGFKMSFSIVQAEFSIITSFALVLCKFSAKLIDGLFLDPLSDSL